MEHRTCQQRNRSCGDPDGHELAPSAHSRDEGPRGMAGEVHPVDLLVGQVVDYHREEQECGPWNQRSGEQERPPGAPRLGHPCCREEREEHDDGRSCHHEQHPYALEHLTVSRCGSDRAVHRQSALGRAETATCTAR